MNIKFRQIIYPLCHLSFVVGLYQLWLCHFEKTGFLILGVFNPIASMYLLMVISLWLRFPKYWRMAIYSASLMALAFPLAAFDHFIIAAYLFTLILTYVYYELKTIYSYANVANLKS